MEARPAMKYRLVLERLLEIERALGVQDTPTVRSMVIEAQELILKLQKEAIESVRSESAYVSQRSL